MTDPVQLIVSAPLGTRMTVRRRVEDGFSDALGYLRECSPTGCVVETRQGLVPVDFADVSAAKLVPPPPPRRAPRYPVE